MNSGVNNNLFLQGHALQYIGGVTLEFSNKFYCGLTAISVHQRNAVGTHKVESRKALRGQGNALGDSTCNIRNSNRCRYG